MIDLAQLRERIEAEIARQRARRKFSSPASPYRCEAILADCLAALAEAERIACPDPDSHGPITQEELDHFLGEHKP